MMRIFIIGLIASTFFSQAHAKSKTELEKYQVSCQGEVATLLMGRETGLDYKKVKELARVRCGYTQEERDRRNWSGVENIEFQGCMDAAVIVTNAEGIEGEKLKDRAKEIGIQRCGWILARAAESKK